MFASLSRRALRAESAFVDTIWNHMTGQDSGTGNAGSSFTKYNYPGIYQNQDFHGCRHGINNWNSATEIQTCELEGLAE